VPGLRALDLDHVKTRVEHGALGFLASKVRSKVKKKKKGKRKEIKHILPVYPAVNLEECVLFLPVFLEECVLFLFASLIHNKILWGNIFVASLFTTG
jgi:hypothetical protein